MGSEKYDIYLNEDIKQFNKVIYLFKLELFYTFSNIINHNITLLSFCLYLKDLYEFDP